MSSHIRDIMGSGDPDLMFADGFDDAILGVCDRFGQGSVVAYDYRRCIDILVISGMSNDEAVEYFDFNVIGAWVGDRTPCFIRLSECL